MISESKIIWIYVLSVIYLLALGISFYFGNFYLLILPLILFVVFGTIFRFDRFFLVIVFFVPLSINLEELNIPGIGLFIPTEPLLAGFSILFVLRELYKGRLPKEILRHPLTISIVLYLVWMLLTSLTSVRPLVSIKYLISRLWFIIPCFFGGIVIFRNLINYKKFIFIYTLPLLIVVVYTVTSHFFLDFTEKTAHWVMSPFFKDHTSYGAALAMFLPISVGMLFTRAKTSQEKLFWNFAFIILTIGTVLSYTRAAWLSLIGVLGLFIIIQFRIKIKYLILILIPIGLYVLDNQSDLFRSLQKNKIDSSDDLAEHVQSMSNISSDASNLERINRWKCALKMFYNKPVQGWGPGTYMFEYGSFQERRDLTFISKFDGSGGNAHSEYLGALSESGLPGAIFFLAIIIVMNITSIKLLYALPPGTIRTLIFSTYLGLMTYVMHGFLNNFLDTDKIGVPFWTFTAFILVVDLAYRNGKKTGSYPKI